MSEPLYVAYAKLAGDYADIESLYLDHVMAWVRERILLGWSVEMHRL